MRAQGDGWPKALLRGAAPQAAKAGAAAEADTVRGQVEGLLARHQQRVGAWEAAAAEQAAGLDARQRALEARRTRPRMRAASLLRTASMPELAGALSRARGWAPSHSNRS